MSTTIFYYTGTGNSLWTAKTLSEKLGHTELRPMHLPGEAAPGSDSVGLVFPVHIWGVPNLVLRFIDRMTKDPSKYYFAFAVNAGQVARTLVQLKNLLSSKGLALGAGYSINLPSNYIPWGGPPPVEKQEIMFDEAKAKIARAAEIIARKEIAQVDKGGLLRRNILSLIYKLSQNSIKGMDKKFWTDEKCSSCGICQKICPVNNIEMTDKKPSWKHHCEQCLACLQWCPQEAIQLGKKTPNYKRYHNPNISLKEMLPPKD